MSTVNSSTSVQDLVKTLLNNFDSNKDGQVSTDEFSSFLSKLLTGVNSAGSTAYVGTALGTSAIPSAATGSAAGTGSGNVKFEGFDFGAVKDPAKSAKYAFAAAAKKAGSMPTSKSDAEAWFNTNIKPEMEKLGHQINWVKGDKFEFSNWQGTFTVDYVRGAGSGDPALAWQVE
jgi:hypothetical protein